VARILGLDPGEHIGWSVADDDEFVAGGEVCFEDLEALFDVYEPDEVVAEEFQVSSPKVNWRPPLETLGAIRLLCLQRNLPMARQSSAILKAWLPRAVGVHRSIHVRASWAHVMCYRAKT